MSDYDELVKALRESGHIFGNCKAGEEFKSAADAIQSLQARVKELEAQWLPPENAPSSGYFVGYGHLGDTPEVWEAETFKAAMNYKPSDGPGYKTLHKDAIKTRLVLLLPPVKEARQP